MNLLARTLMLIMCVFVIMFGAGFVFVIPPLGGLIIWLGMTLFNSCLG